MTMKAHTYYIIFGRPPIGGKLPPFPSSGGATAGDLGKPRNNSGLGLVLGSCVRVRIRVSVRVEASLGFMDRARCRHIR